MLNLTIPFPLFSMKSQIWCYRTSVLARWLWTNNDCLILALQVLIDNLGIVLFRWALRHLLCLNTNVMPFCIKALEHFFSQVSYLESMDCLRSFILSYKMRRVFSRFLHSSFQSSKCWDTSFWVVMTFVFHLTNLELS
jgi:hypothetical protein